MTDLPNNLYRAAQVRELDRVAIEDYSIPGYTLMQRAGQATIEILRARWPTALEVLVIAGPGNNGGDGYVVARLALLAGFGVRVVQLGDPEGIRGDALKARHAYLEVGGQVQLYAGGKLAPCDVIVDALLGTGLEREVRDLWEEVIEAMNDHQAPVLAVDIPSGLHSDRGVPLGTAVRAHCTITFIGMKQGQCTGPALDYCGRLYFHDLNVPSGVYETQRPAVKRIDLQHLRRRLPPRERNSNKGHFGHVLIIGGEQGMSGAARMAAEAAARTGAGLVSVATRVAHAAVLNLTAPELMVHGVDSAQDLEPLLKRSTVLAIGPGLGQTQWSQRLLNAVIDMNIPMVLDADALNLLAKNPSRRVHWVLTPHPGEAARLLQRDVASSIQQDRYEAASALQRRYGGVCVLKGAGTVVCSEERTALCAAGNPGMASAGMGDVLTGVIAALLAQRLSLTDAAELGVCVHALAGDAAAANDGERGLMASDLFLHLRRLINT